MKKFILQNIGIWLVVSIITTMIVIPTGVFANNEETWQAISPNGMIKANVFMQDGSLYYTVDNSGNIIVNPSKLGLVGNNIDMTGSISFINISSQNIDESYSMVEGKSSIYRNNCNEITLTFLYGELYFDVIFRAYDDGVAFCYGVKNDVDIYEEKSEINLKGVTKSWAQQYDDAYEAFYNPTDINSLYGNYAYPMLCQQNQNYVLLTEANLTSAYCGGMLTANGSNLNCRFEPKQTSPVFMSAGSRTPWRAIITGELNAISQTQMPENLCPPCRIDTSWIQPGGTAWSWFNGDPTGDEEVYKKYIDFAAEMGWKYVLLDEGWQPMNENVTDKKSYTGTFPWVSELIEYASQRGIGLWVWAASWDLDSAEKRQRLAEWSSIGIKGVKLDFFNSETQETLKLFDVLTEECAANRLMVNYHGANKPTGLRRTYPNIVTSEGVYGNEHFQSGGDWGPTAQHNCTLPFTRNAVGAMDYTPAISNYNNKNYFSNGQKGALSIVFESGVETFADKPEVYRESPLYDLLKNIPTTWDESRLIDGYPGEYVVMMRKRNDAYYIGSISNGERVVDIPIDFLGNGMYKCEIYSDGDNDETVIKTELSVKNGDVITLPQCVHGGASVKITPWNTSDFNDMFDHWSENVVTQMSEKGRLCGYFYGEFKPDADITRSEFVAMLVCGMNKDLKVGTPRFWDSQNSMLKNYIYTANILGLVNGTTDTEFEPNSNITREQAATVIGRALNIKSDSPLKFSDSEEISDYAKVYIQACRENGIITGYPNGSFMPKSNITRSEAAKIIFGVEK